MDLRNEILDLGCDHKTVFDGTFEGGIHLQQNVDEAIGVIEFLIDKQKQGENIENFLEVGSASGGNCFVLNKYLNLKNIVIVDDNKHHKHHLRPSILKDVNRIEYIGDSQSVEILDKVKETNLIYDFIYIDGGHSYDCVKNDTNNYIKFLRQDGYVIFHDTLIVDDVKKWADEFTNNEDFKRVADFKYKFGVTIFQKIK